LLQIHHLFFTTAASVAFRFEALAGPEMTPPAHFAVLAIEKDCSAGNETQRD
jgi:hypothetical protein